MERIAPVRLAEQWDNVGLLIESPLPPKPGANRILLTNDLTTAVTDEALRTQTSFIVTYHPTIFRPLRSLTLSKPLQANLLRCAANGISVYSPHTALDSVHGGINDWLGNGIVTSLPPKPNDEPGKVSVLSPDKIDDAGGGLGRLVTLPSPITMMELQERIKKHLKLQHIQVAYPDGRTGEEADVRTISICAGSGGSVLVGTKADVYWTGELQHHEVLASIASGHYVVLCGHTNTERGYLPTLGKRLLDELKVESNELQTSDPDAASLLSSMVTHVSEEDKHPLRIV